MKKVNQGPLSNFGIGAAGTGGGGGGGGGTVSESIFLGGHKTLFLTYSL